VLQDICDIPTDKLGLSYAAKVACCSVLQRVAACCSVLQRVAACCSVLPCVTRHLKYTDGQNEFTIRYQGSVLQCIAVCCSVLYGQREGASRHQGSLSDQFFHYGLASVSRIN